MSKEVYEIILLCQKIILKKSHRRSKKKRVDSPLQSEEYEMKACTGRVDELSVVTWRETNDDKNVASVEDEGEEGPQYSVKESSEVGQPAHLATTTVPKPAEDDIYFLNISSFCKYICVRIYHIQ